MKKRGFELRRIALWSENRCSNGGVHLCEIGGEKFVSFSPFCKGRNQKPMWVT
jgi:hypothetical protein